MALPAHWTPDDEVDEPERWLGSSPLLDLEDPKLRLRVRSLVQLCKTDREKAIAVYGYVKRLPLVRRIKLRPRTTRKRVPARSTRTTSRCRARSCTTLLLSESLEFLWTMGLMWLATRRFGSPSWS